MLRYAVMLLGVFVYLLQPVQAAEDNGAAFDKDWPKAAEFKVEPSHTHVLFFVNHLGFSGYPGWFTGVDGTLFFDTESPANSRLNITIDAGSVTTTSAALNDKLKEAAYFNVAQHPTITFNSTSVAKTSDTTGVVSGDLTLLGVTKPVTLDVRFNQRGYNEYAHADMVGFSAKTSINRSEFGMTELVPAVSDKVDLIIEAEFMRALPKASE